MRTLKEALQLLPDNGNAFMQACRVALSGTEGVLVGTTLANFRSPYDSPMDHRTEADPYVTAFICGQKDIISTILHSLEEPGGQPAFNPHSVKKDGNRNRPKAP